MSTNTLAAQPPARPAAAAPTAAPAPFSAATLKPDQAIEVREGDEWSKATVVKKEGRKIQIRYEDGTEEWVTLDRIRAAGASPTTTPTTDDGNNPAQTPKAPKETFKNGAKVEVKSGPRWKPSTIKNRDGDLYLIVYDDRKEEVWWEWVHVAFVRAVGSDKEFYDWGRGVKVWTGGAAKAKEEAKKQFANIEAEIAAAAKGEKKDPFAPIPYDKPVTPAKRENAKDVLADGGPTILPQFDPIPADRKIAERGYVLRGALNRQGPADLLLSGARALAVYLDGASRDRTGKVEILDLASGNNLGLVAFDPLSLPIALAPSGNRVAGRAHGFFSNTKNRIDVFELKGATDPKHMISFVPYAQDSSRDIGWAAFVDDDHLLTCNTAGDLVLWDAPKATAIWQCGVLAGTYPTLSPGGKQLAVMTSDALVVLDPMKGTSLCTIPQSRGVASMSFSPDGKRIVGSNNGVVYYWDLAKGEFGGDIGVGNQGDAVAASGRFALVGGSDLLDLEKKVVVWQYAGGSNSFAGHGGKCFNVISKDGRVVLVAATLPQASAQQAADALATGQGLLLKPGSGVSLEINVEGPEEQRQRIVAALTEQLSRSGISVNANSPITLFARTEQGKTNTQTYEVRQFGRGAGFNTTTETVSSTEKITRLGYEYAGKVVWQTSSTSGGYLPSVVHSSGGKSVGETLQNQNQYQAGWLENARLPIYLPVPTDSPWTGGSQWTVQGVADQRKPMPPPTGPTVPAAAAAPKPARSEDGF